MHAARSILGLVTAAVLVAACGSTGPTPAPSAAAQTASAAAVVVTASPAPSPSAPSVTPSPSATEAPSPSPSAADYGAMFSKAVTDPFFAPHVVLKGVATVAGQMVATQGTIDVNYGIEHTVTTTIANGKKTTTEEISTSDAKYERRLGVWWAAGKPGAGDLSKVVTGIGGFVDAGPDTLNGAPVHHVTLPAGTTVPGTTIGLAGDAAASARVTLEGWADASGRPAAVRVTATWDQPNTGGATAPAQMTVDLTFEGAAPSVTVPTPDQIWKYRTSTLFHYRVAYPSSWEVKRGSKKLWDSYIGFDGTYFGTRGDVLKAWTVNSYTSYAVRHPGKWSGLANAKATSPTSLRVAGSQGRTLMVHGTYKGQVWWTINAVAGHGGRIYVLEMGVPRVPTAADKAMFAAFVANYSFK